jgi:hypothetical protein
MDPVGHHRQELYRGVGAREPAAGVVGWRGRGGVRRRRVPSTRPFVLSSVKRPALVKRKPSGHVVCL